MFFGKGVSPSQLAKENNRLLTSRRPVIFQPRSGPGDSLPPWGSSRKSEKLRKRSLGRRRTKVRGVQGIHVGGGEASSACHLHALPQGTIAFMNLNGGGRVMRAVRGTAACINCIKYMLNALYTDLTPHNRGMSNKPHTRHNLPFMPKPPSYRGKSSDYKATSKPKTTT